jgi:hypothetical protein
VWDSVATRVVHMGGGSRRDRDEGTGCAPSATKLAAVLGVSLPNTPSVTRPKGCPPAEMSKYTFVVTSASLAGRCTSSAVALVAHIRLPQPVLAASGEASKQSVEGKSIRTGGCYAHLSVKPRPIAAAAPSDSTSRLVTLFCTGFASSEACTRKVRARADVVPPALSRRHTWESEELRVH